MSHIFISYSHDDIVYVKQLEDKLILEGFDIWRDVHSIDFGSTWTKEMQGALDSCGALILVASENSFNSRPVQDEIARAKRKNKRIFPLLLDGDAWLTFESTQYVDVRDRSLPPDTFYTTLKNFLESSNLNGLDKTSHPDYFLTSFPWQQYLSNLLKVKKIKTSSHIKPYIELYTETSVKLDEATKNFLNDAQQRILIIEGDALSGKTSFMGRFISDMVKGNNLDTETNLPVNRIPIYFSLRNQSIDCLDKLYSLLLERSIDDKTEQWTKKNNASVFNLFNASEIKWLLYFDGLDEIWNSEDRQQALSIFYEFVYIFPQTKIILTSRPWNGLYAEEEKTKILSIAKLNWQQMENYLISFIDPNSTTVEKIEEYLQPIKTILDEKEPELKQICSLPGYLFAFKTELPFSYEPENIEWQEETIDDEFELQKITDLTSNYDISSINKDTDDLTIQTPYIRNKQVRITKGENFSFRYANIIDKRDYFFMPIVRDADEFVIVLDYDKRQEHEGNANENEAEVIEDIRIGVILLEMYSTIWDREVKRRSENRKTLWQKTGRLAAYIDGKQHPFSIEEVEEIKINEEELSWLLNLGIIKNEGSGYSFYQPITTVIYATDYLRSYYLGEASGETKRKKQEFISNFSGNFNKRVEAMFESIEGIPVQHEEKRQSFQKTLMR